MAPSDREVIALLRERLATVEGAARDLLRVLEETGNERKEAHAAFRGKAVRCACGPFVDTYEQTMAPRLEAGKKLAAALTTDFRTALLSSPEATDEQRATWLAEPV
ncbi:MAG TPA: hypothetical protein VD948_08850 [Rhodothermales bacterium]|nr:hypothetical protein [Rhodothermales bacterium]